MNVIDHLASSLSRKDELPNLELAHQIANTKDAAQVKQLVELLSHKNKDIQSDSIKVIYEIAAINPQLIADYYQELIDLLKSKNNRLQWGAMTALHAITKNKADAVYKGLPQILDAANKGSVITTDHCVGILIELCSIPVYAEKVFPLLVEQLLQCPTNQLPMYAENALPIINSSNKERFIQTLTSRLDEVEKESKRKRVEKVLKSAQNK